MGPWISYSQQHSATALKVQLEGLLHLQDGCPRGVALSLLPQVVHGSMDELRHDAASHLVHHLHTHVRYTINYRTQKERDEPSRRVLESHIRTNYVCEA
jgi:hypothetical protein